jgi:hypothetical protein
MVQTHPLVVAIPRFIQIGKLLPSLKLMAQSRRGATQILGEQAPLVVAIPRLAIGFKGGKGTAS